MLYVKFITGCLATALLLGGCTKETEHKGTDSVEPDADNTRQEVMMTLKNQLVLQKNDTKADAPIATAAENAISTLDVYVFGSKTEDGDYSYLERFAYRADAKDKLPQGATELQLNASGTDDKETTALLKLKKGLFVKLYCIANDTALVDPAADKVIKPADFKPITFTEGEDGTPRFATEGAPLESSFTTWHTHLLTATAKADTLVTPLAMAGAYTTPIDLTTFDNAARIQIGFRLTRLTARFDIDNKAGVSRFIIETVSMGNGRRGSGFFPIRVYGDLPEAKPDQLITYPEHAMYGKNANDGLATGAFYAYPSPKQDKAFLILKGKYKVNETEMKDVSYQIPFMQQTADGNAAWFDITNNHRYTVAIMKANAYHLDADIRVADWADDGSIEYTPDNKPGEIVVTIPDAFQGDTEYDEKAKVVSMSLVDGSQITLTTTTNSALSMTKTYAGGISGEKYDWMEISKPVITPTSNRFTQYTYTVSLKKGYKTGHYPRTTVRLKSLTDGSENILFIEALAVPKPIETKQPPKAPNGTSDNPNSFNPEMLEANIYRITDSHTQVKITCPDGIEVESQPDWLDVTLDSQSGAETVFDLKLKNRDVVVNGNQGIIVFHNKKKNALKINVTVTLLEAPVKPTYDAIGPENIYTPAATGGTNVDDVQIIIKKDNSATVKANSMDGVIVKVDYPTDSPEWLTHNGTTATTKAVAAAATTAATDMANVSAETRAIAMSKQQEIVFKPIESKLASAKTATITLKNNIGGKDYVFTMTPQMQPATAVKGKEQSVPLQDVLVAEKKTATLYQLPGVNKEKSQMQIAVTSLGGSALVVEGNEATVSPAENTANEANYILKPALANGTDKATVTLHAKNYTDKEKMTDYTVTVLRSDLTGDTEASLTAAKDKTVTLKASSYEGFTIDNAAIQWQPDGQTGGARWFNITAADFEAGEKTVTAVAIATTGSVQVRPATVTLKNKIVEGGDLKVVVTPVYAVPTLTVVDKTADPTQNTLTAGATASTVKLYQVTKSTIQIKATGIGGSKWTNASGVTVTGGDTYNTENIYTVTLNDKATAGSFKIVNKSDETKVQTITVQAPVATMTTKNATLPVTLNTTTTAASSSPEGFTAGVTNWGGGSAWFDLTSTDFKNGNQNVTVKVKASLGNIAIKPATVTLTNKIRGGQNLTFTVTPTLAAPTAAYVANTSAPTQNTYDNNATVKLYRVTNSKLNISVTSYGGNKVVSQSGVTVSGGGNNNTTNTYTVTLNNGATGGSFVLGNNSDPSKTKTINVQSPVTTMTTKNATLPVNLNQTATAASSSPEGFTASVTNWGGGGAWFDLPTTSFTNGNQNVTVRVKSSLGNIAIKPATVTLKNKIAGGTDVTFTVTPTLAAPTAALVAKSASPTQNTFDNNVTAKLYQVKNSKLNISVTSYGGNKVVSQSGVTVSGGGNNNTTNTYTVTLNNNSTGGSFVLGNNSDPSKTKTIDVQAPAATLTNKSGNVSLVTNNGQTVDNTINSPEGFTTAINWNGGAAWFTLGSTFNNGDQTVRATMINNLTNVTIKAATVTVTNKIAGGNTLTYTVTPNFQAPTVAMVSNTANRLEGTTVSMFKNAQTPALNSTITLRATATGGTQIAVTGGLSVTPATSSTALTTDYVVKLAYNATSGTITFKNNSNPGKTTPLSVTITETGMIYPPTNEPAIEITGYWLAPTISQSNWSNINCPDGWYVPKSYDIQKMSNSNSVQIVISTYCPSGRFWLNQYDGSDNTGWYVASNCVQSYTNRPEITSWYSNATKTTYNVRCIKNK